MTGKRSAKPRPDRRARVEEDAPAFRALCGDGASHDVARRELGARDIPAMNRQPASSTRIAPSPRTASLTSGVGRTCAVERGRVELHELQVDEFGASARRERQALSEAAERIGAVVVESADPAGRDHDRLVGRRTGPEAPTAITPRTALSSTTRRRASRPSRM